MPAFVWNTNHRMWKVVPPFADSLDVLKAYITGPQAYVYWSTRLFHDEIPSSIRAGVSSGVGTLTWAAFLPFALAFGFVTRHSGVHTAAWMMVAVTAMASVSLVHLATSRRVEASVADRCVALPREPLSTLVPTLVDA